MARNMIFFSSQKQFFQKNWQSLSLLSIFELQVKQIWQYYCQCRFSSGLGKNIGSSIILHNYPLSQSFYFPAQFYSKITLCVFFSAPFIVSLTNLEVRYLIQVAESLIYTNLEIGIFCTVQEPGWHF